VRWKSRKGREDIVEDRVEIVEERVEIVEDRVGIVQGVETVEE